MSSLYDPNTRPFFRKSMLDVERQESKLLSEDSELLYWRFLNEYTAYRCRLPSDPSRLSRILGTTPKKAEKFLRESISFIHEVDGNLMHRSSQKEFDSAVQTSIKQANRRKKEAV